MSKTAIKKRFAQCCAEMNQVLEEAKKIWPDAELYLTPNYMHLMSGPSHDDQCHAREDRVIETCRLDRAAGGDW